jgi:hypothetical protein
VGQDAGGAHRRKRVIHHHLPAVHHILIGGTRDRTRRLASMLAYATLALSLTIRVYDTHGVALDTKAAARAAVDRIVSPAGIHVIWAQCPCDDRVASTELMIRITAAPAAADPASLGFSYVDVEQRAGTLATVFADRVHALAQLAAVDEGELLGRAMAHEIAHLLLGTRDHSAAGLLRGHWTSLELAKNQPRDWQFLRGDGARLQQALARRLRGPVAPATAIARRDLNDASVNAP